MTALEQLARVLIPSEGADLVSETQGLAQSLGRPVASVVKAWVQAQMRGPTVTSLTPSQQAMIEVWRSMWVEVATSCEPTRRSGGTAAIAMSYDSAGLPQPRKINWVRSPAEGLKAIDKLRAKGKMKSVRENLWNKPAEVAHNAMKEHVDYQVQDEVNSGVYSPVRASGWGRIGSQIETHLLATLGLKTRPKILAAGYGSQDAHWLAQYSFYFQVCGLVSPNPLRGLCCLALDCWWWWPFESDAIACEKPTELSLSSTELKSIRFADGTGIDL